MCISPDAYLAARVFERLHSAGVSEAKAEAVARKVARRAADKRYAAYRRYLTGVPEELPLAFVDTVTPPGVSLAKVTPS